MPISTFVKIWCAGHVVLGYDLWWFGYLGLAPYQLNGVHIVLTLLKPEVNKIQHFSKQLR